MLMFVAVSFEPDMVKGEEQTGQSSEPGNLYALSACLMDADSGRILYEKNGDEKRANASTTKILTLILTLEHGDLEQTVTVSSYAAAQPEVKLHMREGEQYRLKDLCYSMMLESHNDSAVAIAEAVGGSVEKFAGQMNQKANEIGCRNTNFITPNGLDKENSAGIHGTTAEELALILRYCIMESPKREEFLEITRTDSYSFTDMTGARSFNCNNHNALLKMMDGALTGKTGFTGNAGYCYVGAVQKGENTYIVALLACGWPNNKGYKWADVKKLVSYAENSFYRVNLSQDVEEPEQIRIRNAKNDEFLLEKETYGETVCDLSPEYFLVNEQDTFKTEYICPNEMEAPTKNGEQIGSLVYYINNEAVVKRPVILKTKTIARDEKWFLELVLDRVLL